MPATTENSVATELSPTRRDSTFSYDPSPVSPLQPAEMERMRGAAKELSASTEHIRTDSADSGIGFACPLALRTPGVISSTRRSTSESADLHKQHRDSTASNTSLSEHTQLFLEKMILLEKKLQSMESQLKNEQVQRLALEAKVIKLERDNEQLKSSRALAGQQLQNFAEIFYSETETIKLSGSCTSSPHPSLAELRRSRTDSLSSNSSLHSRNSRFSHISM